MPHSRPRHPEPEGAVVRMHTPGTWNKATAPFTPQSCRRLLRLLEGFELDIDVELRLNLDGWPLGAVAATNNRWRLELRPRYPFRDMLDDLADWIFDPEDGYRWYDRGEVFVNGPFDWLSRVQVVEYGLLELLEEDLRRHGPRWQTLSWDRLKTSPSAIRTPPVRVPLPMTAEERPGAGS